jgi:dinuclear metal center YbgI/SA1388 family protein
LTISFSGADLIAHLDDLLEPGRFADLGPNGLQVPTIQPIARVASGVSASRSLIESAIGQGAQLVLVHHGLFWDFHPTGLTPVLAGRLRPLLTHDVGLAAYHLPLDAHPEHGNAALLAEALGAESHEPFGTYKGMTVGRAADFADVTITELLERVHAATGREPLLQGAGPERVRRLGIVTGSGADSLQEAAGLGLDGLLTGEPREHVHRDAAELGLHFIAAGHYATETFGIRRLGDLLQERFGIEHLWIDEPNPV